MSSVFDLAPQAQRNLEQRAEQSPMTMGELPYSIASDVKAPFIGLAASVNDVAMLGMDALEPSFRATIGKTIDETLNTGGTVQEWSAKARQATHDMARYLQPDETASWFGKNVLYGLTETVPQFLAGTVLAGGDPLGGAVAVGGIQANKTAQLMNDQGVDPVTALAVGGLAGAAGVAGAFLPVKAPSIIASMTKNEVSSLAANLSTGLATNIPFGMVNRTATGALLEQRGYHDMAQQYKALDGAAILADAVMGVAFAGYGHWADARAKAITDKVPMPVRPTPEQTDAALTVLNQHHAAVETAPGLPVDPQSAETHRQALTTALEQLIAGEPVEVGAAATLVKFEENTAATQARQQIADAISVHLDLPTIEMNQAGALPRVPANLAGAIMGNESFVKIGDNYVPVRYAVVDAAEHQATLTVGDNQFRNRNSAASEAQITKIANEPDFNLLNAAPLMDFGAPTMNGEGKIIGGNGRFEGVSRSYDQGSSEPYLRSLEGNLEKFGIRDTATAGMKKPVLVRVIEANIDTQRAALASNEGAGARMGAIDQARADALRFPDITGVRVGENGEILSGPNHALIRAWIKDMPITEMADLVDKGGRLSANGMERFQNAILFKAFGDSPILARLLESKDPGAKNVAAALTKVAGQIAKIKAEIERGEFYPQLDLTPDIIVAADKLEELRASGTKVADYLNQGELFGGKEAPDTRKILQFFGEHMRSAKAMGDMLREYWRLAESAGNPKQEDLLGGQQVPRKTDLLDQAIAETRKTETPDQSELPFAGQANDTANVNELVAKALNPKDLSDLPAGQGEVLRGLYERAARLKGEFDRIGREVADLVGGELQAPALKGSARAVEKINDDYAGNASNVKDLLRATVVVDNLDQARQAAALLQERFKTVGKVRDLLDPSIETVDGYRDVKMNVQLDGLIAEMQVNLREMAAAKEKMHVFYEERRSIEGEINRHGGKATAEEQARIDELNAEMRPAYEAAWSSATKALNSASETGAPLRRAESGLNERGGSLSQAAQYGTSAPGMLPKDTGMPSTSKSMTPEGNAGKSIETTSDRNIGSDNGVVNSSTPRDFFDAANIVAERPDLLIPGPDGELIPASQALASADAEISMAKRDSQGYDAAVACALRG
jgi:hypothetical protein